MRNWVSVSRSRPLDPLQRVVHQTLNRKMEEKLMFLSCPKGATWRESGEGAWKPRKQPVV